MKSNTLASSAIALGLFAIAGSQVFSSISDRQPSPVADVQPVAAVERVANVAGPGEPFIVWYDSQVAFIEDCGGCGPQSRIVTLMRAWSDGTVEARSYSMGGVFSLSSPGGLPNPPSQDSGWVVISQPNEGLAAISDANADEAVDLVDLNLLLAHFGPAPRNDIPESPCPFGLIPG